ITEPARIAAMRDQVWQGINDLPGVQLNGHPSERACGHLNVAFGGCDGEMLLLSLRDLAVSSGSACNSASLSPSYVLKAIGLNDELRSEEHTSELQSRENLVCRLLLEKKN